MEDRIKRWMKVEHRRLVGRGRKMSVSARIETIEASENVLLVSVSAHSDDHQAQRVTSEHSLRGRLLFLRAGLPDCWLLAVGR